MKKLGEQASKYNTLTNTRKKYQTENMFQEKNIENKT